MELRYVYECVHCSMPYLKFLDWFPDSYNSTLHTRQLAPKTHKLIVVFIDHLHQLQSEHLLISSFCTQESFQHVPWTGISFVPTECNETANQPVHQKIAIPNTSTILTPQQHHHHLLLKSKTVHQTLKQSFR